MCMCVYFQECLVLFYKAVDSNLILLKPVLGDLGSFSPTPKPWPFWSFRFTEWTAVTHLFSFLVVLPAPPQGALPDVCAA